MTTAVDCWNDLLARIRTMPEFVDKTEAIWSEEDLLRVLKGAKSPMAGVIYGGITANALDPSRQGMANDLSCTILVIVEGSLVGGLDDKAEAVRLLDEVRKTIRLSVSPTGHKWRFVREAPSGQIGNKLVYQQTWSTAIILTS